MGAQDPAQMPQLTHRLGETLATSCVEALVGGAGTMAIAP
jgi:hypothetical protein